MPITNVNVNLPTGDPTSPTGTPGLESYQLSGGPNVINLLRIPGEQQVMLRVTVAEVNRAAARSIGLNFSFLNNNGIPVFSQLTGNINGAGLGGIGSGGLISAAGTASQIAGGLGGAGGGGAGLLNQGTGLAANLPTILDNGRSDRHQRPADAELRQVLARPNLVALNGRTASFRSGRQFPVLVLGGSARSTARVGPPEVQFIPFGVRSSSPRSSPT